MNNWGSGFSKGFVFWGFSRAVAREAAFCSSAGQYLTWK